MTAGTRRIRAHGGARRRGIALMLVLLVMGAAVIMGAALLSMDGSSSQAGDNALAQVQAEWAAEGAAAHAVAAFEAGVAASVNSGELISDMAMGSAVADVTVTNLAGDPPSEGDRELLMKVSADVGGVKSKVTRRLVIPARVEDAYDAVDPYMREYAIFAEDYLRADLGSTMGVWGLDPQSGASKWVNIGLGFELPSGLSLAATPAATVCFFTDASANAIMDLLLDLYNILGRGHHVSCEVPAVAATLPSAITGLPVNGAPLASAIGTRTVIAGAHYGNCAVSSGATLIFDEAVATHYRVEDFSATTGGAFVIKGDVTIHVRDDMVIQNGGIIALFDDQARLTLLVNETMLIDDSTVGVPVSLARSGRGVESMIEWVNPDRIRIVQIRTADGGESNPAWQVNNNSSVVACLHAPNADFQLSNSTLAGRVTAKEVVLQAGGELLYSPSLNNGVGFTTLDGPLYSGGAVTSGVASVLNAVVPSNGMDVYAAALRAIEMSATARVHSTKVDEEAAAIEKRPSVADAGDGG